MSRPRRADPRHCNCPTGTRSLAESNLQIVSSYLQLEDGSRADLHAAEAHADGRRFFLGVGEGKLVAAGTDVGLRPSAQRCLDALLDVAWAQETPPSINLIPIRPGHSPADYVRRAMSLANDGDFLFFVVDDWRGCEAVMRAINVSAEASF